MIVKTNCEADGSFAALISTHNNVVHDTLAAHGGVHDAVYNPCKEIDCKVQGVDATLGAGVSRFAVKRLFWTGLEMNCIF